MAFVIRGIQGEAVTFTIPLSGGTFTGAEILTATVETGTGEPPLLTLAPVWTWGQTVYTTVDIPFTGSQMASLSPGGYIVLVGIAGGAGALAWGTLRVHPGAGTTPILRTLVTPGQAFMIQPDLVNQQDDIDSLAPILVSATKAIETYCRRPLVLTLIDRYYRPGRTRKINLHTWPIAPDIRLKCDLVTAITLTNTSVGNTIAYVGMTPSSAYNLTPSVLTLYWTDVSGATHTQSFTLSTYATIGALGTAINAVGSGWRANVVGNSYSGQNLSTWPTSELLYDPGYHGCLSEGAEIFVFGRDLVRFGADWIRGTIELTENRPEAFRYADRAFGIGFGWSWSAAAEPKHANVRATYRGGYAIAAADIASGLEPVPEDLQVCTIATAAAIMRGLPLISPLVSQTVKDRSYTLRDMVSFIPRECRAILDSRYVNQRIF